MHIYAYMAVFIEQMDTWTQFGQQLEWKNFVKPQKLTVFIGKFTFSLRLPTGALEECPEQ